MRILTHLAQTQEVEKLQSMTKHKRLSTESSDSSNDEEGPSIYKQTPAKGREMATTTSSHDSHNRERFTTR